MRSLCFIHISLKVNLHIYLYCLLVICIFSYRKGLPILPLKQIRVFPFSYLFVVLCLLGVLIICLCHCKYFPVCLLSLVMVHIT